MRHLVKTMLLLITVFTLTVCLSSPATAVKPVVFGNISVPKIKVGEGFGYQTWSAGQHSLVTLGDNVYAVWTKGDIWFAMSEDGGLTWGEAKLVSSPGTYPSSASIAVSPDGVVHVAYEAGYDVKYTQRSTSGSWTTPVSVTGGLQGQSAAIAVYGNNDINVGWFAGSNVVYHSKSTDGGYTWASPIQVNSGDGGSYPSIATDGSGNVYMTWGVWGNPDKVYFSRYNGSNWSSQIAINDTYEFGFFPSISATDTNNIYIGWPDYSNGIIVASTHDGGNFWSQVAIDPQYGIDDVSLNVGPNGDVYVTYESSNMTGCAGGSNRHVYVSRSTDGASSFETPVFVSCNGKAPNLAVDSNNKALIMWGGDYPRAIFFNREQ